MFKRSARIRTRFFKVLDKYSNDKGYDDHFRSLLYPIINQLYSDLQKYIMMN